MAKKPKVIFVKFESQADYKVFFCNQDSQQRNHQMIQGAELVKNDSQADLKLFVVKFDSQADIKITQKNFAKAA